MKRATSIVVALTLMSAGALAGCSGGSTSAPASASARGLAGDDFGDAGTCLSPGTLVLVSGSSGSKPSQLNSANDVASASLSPAATAAANDFLGQGGQSIIVLPAGDTSAGSLSAAADHAADFDQGAAGVIAVPDMWNLSGSDWTQVAQSMAHAAQSLQAIAVIDPPAASVTATMNVDGGDPQPLADLAATINGFPDSTAQWAVLLGGGVTAQGQDAHAASGAWAGVVSSQAIGDGVGNATGANTALSGLEAQFTPSKSTMGTWNEASVVPIIDADSAGTMFWGQRLVDSSHELRYVSQRMMVSYLDTCLNTALEQFVFQPNDENTWSASSQALTDVLTNLWQQGGLVGSSPDDAFSVDCGADTDTILNGKYTCQVTAKYGENQVYDTVLTVQSQGT